MPNGYDRSSLTLQTLLADIRDCDRTINDSILRIQWHQIKTISNDPTIKPMFPRLPRKPSDFRVFRKLPNLEIKISEWFTSTSTNASALKLSGDDITPLNMENAAILNPVNALGVETELEAVYPEDPVIKVEPASVSLPSVTTTTTTTTTTAAAAPTTEPEYILIDDDSDVDPSPSYSTSPATKTEVQTQVSNECQATVY